MTPTSGMQNSTMPRPRGFDTSNQQVYAGETAELLGNMTRDALRSSAASDLQLCAAYLQSDNGGGGGNGAVGRRLLAWDPVVPGEVDCRPTGKPGVRCGGDPCQHASCPAVPEAACVPNFCRVSCCRHCKSDLPLGSFLICNCRSTQTFMFSAFFSAVIIQPSSQGLVKFRGRNLTRPCTAVFVDTSNGDVVDCTKRAIPVLGGSTTAGAGFNSDAITAALGKAAAAFAASRGGGSVSASTLAGLLSSGAEHVISWL